MFTERAAAEIWLDVPIGFIDQSREVTGKDGGTASSANVKLDAKVRGAPSLLVDGRLTPAITFPL